jgi:hypothetical protein
MTTITLDDQGIERLIAVGALPIADGIGIRQEEPLFNFNTIALIIGIQPEVLAAMLIRNKRFNNERSDAVTCRWMGENNNDTDWRLGDEEYGEE